MNINLSPTDLTLLAVAVNEKIARLDEQRVALGIERERVGGAVKDGEEVNLIIRTTYATIVRRIEQALDVPFMDDETASVLIAAGLIQ